MFSKRTNNLKLDVHLFQNSSYYFCIPELSAISLALISLYFLLFAAGCGGKEVAVDLFGEYISMCGLLRNFPFLKLWDVLVILPAFLGGTGQIVNIAFFCSH